MKRGIASLLAALLLLLSGCGAADPVPGTTTEASTSGASTETTNETTQSTESAPVVRMPFSEDDARALEPGENTTVAEFAALVPAQWYQVLCWIHVEGEVHVSFYDHEPVPGDESSHVGWWDDPPFFSITTTGDVAGISDSEETYILITQTLPEALLAAEATIANVDFAKATAIKPPRGIRIGDSAQAVLDAFPEEDAQTEQGEDGYEISHAFTYSEGIYDEKKLTYNIDENDIIQGIKYRYWYHAN